METLKALAPHAGIFFAALGLLLNAYALLRNIESRKLLNYQEITKSHREIWKLTLDEPEKYSRVLEVAPDLEATPISAEERRFVNLLLLHMTSAFYFAKGSDIVKIQQLRADVHDVMSLPIPRSVWDESRHYFNHDFVRFIEGTRSGALWQRIIGRRKVTQLRSATRWTILVLTGFPDKLLPIVARFGDRIISIRDSGFILTPAFLRENAIDLVICFGYGQILSAIVLRQITAINIHLGYLPYDRGPNPNLWAILKGSQRGATIHYIDEGIDTGDIIAQREVPLPVDALITLQSAFDQLVNEAVALFGTTWPEIRAGRNKRIPQPNGGTRHTLTDQKPLASLLTKEGLSLPINEFRKRAGELLSPG